MMTDKAPRRAMMRHRPMNPTRPTWSPVATTSKNKRLIALPPGSLVHRGERRTKSAHIRLIQYNEAKASETSFENFPQKAISEDEDTVTWLHFTGLHDVEELARIGKEFGISSLILEDILHTGSRSKIENHESEIFVVAKLITIDEKQNVIDVQHFSLLLLHGNVVLTFAESPTAAFDPVIERIKTNVGGRIRRFKADYLSWAILDMVVDNYLYVMDQLDEAVIAMDERLQSDPTAVEVGELYALKRDINQFHRLVRPIREISGSLMRDNSSLTTATSEPFFVDLHDHAIQAIEKTDDLRENSSSLREFYLSEMSNRMNEVMKVLTCFSTIFLPLTFIVGIYGMNFEKMPELSMRWGYPAVWVLFFVCAGGMFWLFRRMKWL